MPGCSGLTKEASHFCKLCFFTDIMIQMTPTVDGDWIPTPSECEAITLTSFQTSREGR